MKKIFINTIAVAVCLLFNSCDSDYHKEEKIVTNFGELYLHCYIKGYRTTYSYYILNSKSGIPDLKDSVNNLIFSNTETLFYKKYSDSVIIYSPVSPSLSSVYLKQRNIVIRLLSSDEYYEMIHNYPYYKEKLKFSYFGVREEKVFLQRDSIL